MYLDNYIGKIKELCEKHKVKHLFAFGSVINDKFSEESDIDLLEQKALKNPYLIENINKSKKVIYEN